MTAEGFGNVLEGFFSSIFSDGNSNSNDSLSPEDDSWVNSCLVQDPELSDSDWDAMKDALLEFISSQNPSDHNTSAEYDGSHTGSSMDVLMNWEGEGKRQGPSGTNSDHVQTKGLQVPPEFNADFTLITKKEANELFQGFLQKDNPISCKKGKMIKAGATLSVVGEMEAPPEDIFKVWDLNTTLDEEDDLVKQLEQALAETPLRSESFVLDNSVGSGLDMGTLDSLISGLTDLSLDPTSGS